MNPCVTLIIDNNEDTISYMSQIAQNHKTQIEIAKTFKEADQILCTKNINIVLLNDSLTGYQSGLNYVRNHPDKFENNLIIILTSSDWGIQETIDIVNEHIVFRIQQYPNWKRAEIEYPLFSNVLAEAILETTERKYR